ncbi:MAG: hypothetical protein EAX91_17880 [Candidatus Lokiarchaeota archaeon]|nr:hypothetical protein [Candidatus Lokiarchaeota archaeon]
MIDCRVDSFRSFLSLIALALGGLAFIIAFLSVIYDLLYLFIDFKGYIFYLIPPLIVCIVSGNGIIYFSIVYKFK